MGSGGRAAGRWTVNREDGGSIPLADVSKLRQFRPHGPFYLVSMPGEVKSLTTERRRRKTLKNHYKYK